VDRQARAIAGWLGDAYACERHDGLAAFERLGDADLLVLMGLHWTGLTPESSGGLTYHPLRDADKEALERYVASGRPVIAHHGAIASYDDWPRFGQLVGFAWIWGQTSHSPVGDYTVRARETGHPIIEGVGDFTIHDELYYDIAIAPGLEVRTHAEAEYDGRRLPMVLTAEGGRTPGAGKVAYLAIGHDMKAFECPALKRLWTNAVDWCLRG
jgi:type 1 glutamine amidotransferase